jgi:hypothetical protein
LPLFGDFAAGPETWHWRITISAAGDDQFVWKMFVIPPDKSEETSAVEANYQRTK